ncbi:MAG: hypothetical protein DI527_01050 [Chelatococcus sp.]|nr:MAG: hypothetical protein DI527_01050 [Chelatococcus sp.]
MSVPVWPSLVPARPVVSGVSAGATHGAPIESQTEGGPPIMRPRPGPRSTELPFRSVLLTRAQWAAFEQFARVDLRGGSLVFEMPVFRPDAGMVARKCQIKGGQWETDYSAASRFRVSFTLVVWNY